MGKALRTSVRGAFSLPMEVEKEEIHHRGTETQRFFEG
jgi:hypothetical protein